MDRVEKKALMLDLWFYITHFSSACKLTKNWIIFKKHKKLAVIRFGILEKCTARVGISVLFNHSLKKV